MDKKGLRLGMGFSKWVVLFIFAVLLCLYFFISLQSIEFQPLSSRWSASKTAAPLPEAEALTPTNDHFTAAVNPVTVTPPAATSSQTPHKTGTAVIWKITKAFRPSGTTEPAYIGDRYAMDDVSPRTSCVNGIRQKVKQTAFGKLFLEHVPVLQWQKHGSPEEYQRLRQYPGAHGWGSVDYDALMATLSILNMSANRLMFDDWEQRANGSSCIRCAVVGNGGILQGSKKGPEIDQHDYIFRTNGAVINGFEEDVGSRTTMYTFSTNTMRNSMASYRGLGYKGPPLSEETRYVFLPDHDRDYILLRAAATHTPVQRGPESSKIPPRYFGDNVTVEKFKMYHPDFIRYIRNRFLHSDIMKTPYRNIYRPSTGAVMLLAALHTCDQVSAYGFMTPDYTKYSDHYYDKQYRGVTFYANHDLRLELVLWQQLHQAGLIRLYMRQ